MTVLAPLTARRSTSVVEREKRLWQDLVVNFREWRDHRLDKKSVYHPDFRHRTIREPLWLSSQHKPSWIDARLPPAGSLAQPTSSVSPPQGYGDLDKMVHILLCMPEVPTTHCLFWSLARGCGAINSLSHSKQFFKHLIDLGLEAFSLLAEYLLGIFTKCGDVKTVVGTFDMLPHRGVFSWTALIFMYVDKEEPKMALHMYELMSEEKVNPTERTFVALLRACGCALDLEKGMELHDTAIRADMATNAFVSCTVVSMYGKCESLREAWDTFCRMPNHCVISWTALLSSFVEQGEEKESLQIYKLMLEEGVNPNDRTFVVALDACGEFSRKELFFSGRPICVASASLEIGRCLHADARKRMCHFDSFICSALLSMYGKSGRIVEAENVFIAGKVFDQQSIVPWNAMLSAYLECGLEHRALQLYAWTLKQHFSINKRTHVIAIQASSMLAEKEEAVVIDQKSVKFKSLEVVHAIHKDAQSRDYAKDAHLGSALVCAYSKCGNAFEAEQVFSGLHVTDIIAWTALLFMYVELNDTNKALQVFAQMQNKGIIFDDVIFVCALQACAKLGNLRICEQIYFALCHSTYSLSTALALNIIHTYGDCTCLESAKAVFVGLPSPDVVLWTALGDAYARSGKYANSLASFEESRMAGINPDGVSFVVALSACGHIGLVDKGIQYFESMYREHGLSPEVEHYVCVANILGRVGDILKLEAFLSRMDPEPGMAFWLSLLETCQIYGNVELANRAFNQAMQLDPKK